MSDETNSQSDKQNSIPNYQSGDILYEISKSEYEHEKNRTTVIDSKANIVLSLCSAFLVIITQVINLKKLCDVEIQTFFDCLIPATLFLLICGSTVLSFVSLILLLRVIFTKQYCAIDSNYFNDIEKLKNEKQLFYIATAQFYIEATTYNKNVNDKRISLYQRGLVLLVFSIFLFILFVSLESFI